LTYLITGATGNVGKYVLEKLTDKEVFAGISSEASVSKLPESTQYRIIRFGEPSTYESALKNIDCIFLMRPPHISNIKRDIVPFLEAAKAQKIKHIVFLSLAGAEKNIFVPHHKVEAAIKALSIPYTFIRPTFFMQNLSTTHLEEIRNKNEIIVPAGKGKTNFIDVRDIAAAAAEIIGKSEHYNKGYTITGQKSYTYFEIASIMSDVLKMNISYNNPSMIRFYRLMRKKGYQRKFIFVMIGIYATTKFGLADINTDELQGLINREPISFREFLKDYQEIFKNN